MVMASAGQIASHSLQAMQRSSPFSYRRSACRPRKRGDSGVFSSGNCTVMCGDRKCRPVSASPLNSSVSMKLEKKSLTEVAADMSVAPFPRLFPDVPGRLDPQPDDDQPDQRDGNED